MLSWQKKILAKEPSVDNQKHLEGKNFVKKQSILCILGPTASGKTQLAIELSQRYPIEIISVDSAMVYRQLSIGANKPSEQELALCPHHLINMTDVTKPYNVQRFVLDVTECINAIQKREKIPILVGGSMMYFYQLIHGLAPIPSITPEQQNDIASRLKEKTLHELFLELQEVDPPLAHRIGPQDTQRIKRGLEVFWGTKKPLSSYFEQTVKSPYSFEILALCPDDKLLHRQIIAERLQSMVHQGIIEEVSSLWRDYPNEHMDFWKFVGYRQFLTIFTQNINQKVAEEKAFLATAQLAKRQKTWFNKFNCTLCPVFFKNNQALSPVFTRQSSQILLNPYK